MELSELSRKRLQGVHPDLVRVVKDAAENAPFEILVVDGLRTVAQQKKFVASGKSTTMNSRHLTGHAVDLCAIDDNGKLQWGKQYANGIAELMEAAAKRHDIPLEWGGAWKSFVDTPHWQLPWKEYPKQDTSWHTQATTADTNAAVLKKSRKHRAAGWMKWGMGVTGGGMAGWPAIKEQITIGQDIVATAQQVLTANSLIVVSGICIASAIAFNWIQLMQKDDLTEGRYTPSGADQ